MDTSIIKDVKKLIQQGNFGRALNRLLPLQTATSNDVFVLIAVCEFRKGDHNAFERLYSKIDSKLLDAPDKLFLLRHEYFEYLKLGQLVTANKLLGMPVFSSSASVGEQNFGAVHIEIRLANQARGQRSGMKHYKPPRAVRAEHLATAKEICKRIDAAIGSSTTPKAELVAAQNNYLQLIIELMRGDCANDGVMSDARQKIRQVDGDLGKHLPKKPFFDVVYRPSF